MTGEGEQHSITIVAEADLPELLALLRAYCDFYRVAPPDEDLLSLCRALIADPWREGVQMIARDEHDEGRAAVGFATVFWTWSTTRAMRVGVMHDLFVVEAARGLGLAERLIAACVERCAEHGAGALEWETALDNLRAQKVYDRVGGRRSRWLSYKLRRHGRRQTPSVQSSEGIVGCMRILRGRGLATCCAALLVALGLAGAARAQPVGMAAPYEYLGWGNPQPPAEVMAATGVHDLTLAFMLSHGRCNPAVGRPPPADRRQRSGARSRRSGRPAATSTCRSAAGAGRSSAAACKTVAALAARTRR